MFDGLLGPDHLLVFAVALGCIFGGIFLLTKIFKRTSRPQTRRENGFTQQEIHERDPGDENAEFDLHMNNAMARRPPGSRGSS
jgi:hypothetical protein